jgi:hypothetical protein
MTHKAELVIVPAGIRKGYPTFIDFDLLPKRIKAFEDSLRNIVEGSVESPYRELALEAYKKAGKKARYAMSLMSRFEVLQVRALKCYSSELILKCPCAHLFVDRLLWSTRIACRAANARKNVCEHQQNNGRDSSSAKATGVFT